MRKNNKVGRIVIGIVVGGAIGMAFAFGLCSDAGGNCGNKVGTLTVRTKSQSPPSPRAIQQKIRKSLFNAHSEQLKKSRSQRGECKKAYITMYYSVMRGQSKYAYGRTYEQDFAINCQGDCMVTASGISLYGKHPMTVAACDPAWKFGSTIEIDGMETITCIDRGGAIKENRIDLWFGQGEEGLNNLYRNGWVQGEKEACIYNN